MRIKKNTLITGTIILTITGLGSRLIGFFYRIFLSRLFGEENMGIYQLIGPVMALVFSLSAAGLQNAISKFVAGETATHDYKASLRILLVGLSLIHISVAKALHLRHIMTCQYNRLSLCFQSSYLLMKRYSSFHIKPGSRFIKKNNIRIADQRKGCLLYTSRCV